MYVSSTTPSRSMTRLLHILFLSAFMLLMLGSSTAFAQWDENKSLCEETGGEWEETSCGDYYCGQPPLCLALIPGCNCGPGLNFDDKEGCYKDIECPAPGECTYDWDCAPCGVCVDGMCVDDDGNPPECYTDEDCGPGGTCLDDICPATCIYIIPPTKKQQCENTGGTWDPNSCGDYLCGETPLCEAIIPGCNCGPTMNMTANGCKEDITCGGEEPECETDEDCEGCFGFCGGGTCYYTGLIQCENDAECGEGFICDECGQCTQKPGEEGGGDTPKELCEATGGKWDPSSCGDYTCGAPPTCEAIIPGCDCGPDMNMTAEGCVKDSNCGGEEEGGEASEEEGGEASEEDGGEATEEEGGEATEEEGGEATEEEGGEATEEGGEAAEEEGGEATEEDGGEATEEDGGGLPDYAEFELECQKQGLDFSTKTTSCTPVTCEEALGEGVGEGEGERKRNLVVDQCETEYPGPGCVCPEETPITHPELGCITVAECPTNGEEEGGEIQTIEEEGAPAVVSETAADEGCQSSHDGKPLAAAILLSVLVLLGGLRRKFSINP